MKKTLIVGIGSVLRGDDGIGVRIVTELEKTELSENVKLQAGDISGLDLLKFFPDFDKVILIDAADMTCNPGTIKVFKADEIKEADFDDKFSTHGMKLLETLTLAKKTDIKSEITIVGIQPFSTSFNLNMTKEMENRVPEILSRVKELL